MSVDDPQDRIRCRFEFDPTQVRDIAKWIDEFDARYVVMDSFGSLFAGGADLVDANWVTTSMRVEPIGVREECGNSC